MKKLYNESVWNSAKAQNLIEAVLALQNEKEAKSFLADILTPAEIKEFGNRLQAAQMLQNKEKYLDIQKATGLSTTTIARISSWLQNGAGGYQSILAKLNHTHITAP